MSRSNTRQLSPILTGSALLFIAVGLVLSLYVASAVGLPWLNWVGWALVTAGVLLVAGSASSPVSRSDEMWQHQKHPEDLI